MNWFPLVVIAAIITMMKPWESFNKAKEIQRNIQKNEVKQSRTYQLVPGSIYDGDTLRVTDGFQEMKIRLCGIDAPEKEQPMGLESRDHLRSLIEKGDGSVMVAAVKKDRYGRTVAELFIQPRPGQGYQADEEIPVNAQMVSDGFAYHYAQYSSGCPNGQILARLETEAQQQRRGVWKNPTAQKPWDFRNALRQ